MAAFATIDLTACRSDFGSKSVPALEMSLAELSFPRGFIAGAHAEDTPFHFASVCQHFDGFAYRRGLVWLGKGHLTYVNLSVPLTD